MSDSGRRIQRPRDPEIGHERVAASEQDVFGLDVTMHDPTLVGVIEGIRHVPYEAEGFIKTELGFAPEPVAEGFALYVRHRVPEVTGGLTGVVHGQNVWMLQACGHPNLTMEPLPGRCGCEPRVENLQSDEALMLRGPRKVDRSHTAAAELALDGIAVAKGVGQQPS